MAGQLSDPLWLMAPKYIWDPRRLYEQQQFYMHEMGYTIADDYDPDGEIRFQSKINDERAANLQLTKQNALLEFQLNALGHKTTLGKTQ
jgi:hypothetical protein